MAIFFFGLHTTCFAGIEEPDVQAPSYDSLFSFEEPTPPSYNQVHIEDLETEIQNLTQKILQLEQLLTTKKQECVQLLYQLQQSQPHAQSETLTNLQNKNVILEKKISDLRKRYDSLRSKHSSLDWKLFNMKQTYNDLQRELELALKKRSYYENLLQMSDNQLHHELLRQDKENEQLQKDLVATQNSIPNYLIGGGVIGIALGIIIGRSINK